MTKEEAIKILSNRNDFGIPSGYIGTYSEAFDMALAALVDSEKEHQEIRKEKQMIINIPLQIDEKIIENNLSVDYETKIKDYILNEVKEALISKAKDKYKYFSNKPTATEGVEIYVHHYIDHYIQEWKNEIVELAAEKLAERLAKTKAAKELIKNE